MNWKRIIKDRRQDKPSNPSLIYNEIVIDGITYHHYSARPAASMGWTDELIIQIVKDSEPHKSNLRRGNTEASLPDLVGIIMSKHRIGEEE